MSKKQETLLLKTYRTLGPNGQKILMQVAERLDIGMSRYGDFGDKSKDMDKEAREELIDAIVYLTRKL